MTIFITEGSNELSTPMIAVIAVLAVGCVVGTAYGVGKRQNWKVGEMVSKHMPYNRNREQRLAGSTFSSYPFIINHAFHTVYN